MESDMERMGLPVAENRAGWVHLSSIGYFGRPETVHRRIDRLVARFSARAPMGCRWFIPCPPAGSVDEQCVAGGFRPGPHRGFTGYSLARSEDSWILNLFVRRNGRSHRVRRVRLADCRTTDGSMNRSLRSNYREKIG
jgi:hypothetical protein